MKKNFGRIIGYIIGYLAYYIPYLFIWLYAAAFFTVLENEGLHVDFGIAYGKPFSYIFRILSVLIFVSAFLLPFIKKKKFIAVYFILPYLLSAVLFASSIALDNHAADKMTFSTERWIEYPQLRPTMYEDFKENFNLDGYTKDEIELLLGQPSEASENLYIYGDGKGNNVYIEFRDGLAADCYFIG